MTFDHYNDDPYPLIDDMTNRNSFGKLEPTMVPELHKALPNLKALHPDTVYQVFREYKPVHAKVEITIYYREPNKDKQRIDVDFTDEFFLEEGLKPEYFKITYWGSAVRF